MAKRLKIAVFGTGSVGGYFGARLPASGEEVSFIARGRQLDTLRHEGLSIVSPNGDVHLGRLVVTDRLLGGRPIDIPMSLLFGNTPKLTRRVERLRVVRAPSDAALVDVREAAFRE